MGTTAKICSIKKTGSDEKTMANALALKGFNRFPGSVVRFIPYKESDGRYRTGLDEKALYLAKLPKEERELEVEKIKALRERLEAETGLELGPRSNYYTKMFDEGFYGTQAAANFVKLKDGENVFNLDDVHQAITYAWLSVHPMIAPSYEHYRKGLVPPGLQFYVSNPEVENQITFDEKKMTNKAIVELDTMSPDKRKKVARLLAIPVSDGDTEVVVYNLLDTFIKQGEIRSGINKGALSTRLFLEISSMKDETLEIKDLVEQGLIYGVYRRRNDEVFEGEMKVADNKEDLVKKLSNKNAAQDVIALEKKIKEKKILES